MESVSSILQIAVCSTNADEPTRARLRMYFVRRRKRGRGMRISSVFGEKFSQRDARIASYELIRRFIADHHDTLDTVNLVAEFTGNYLRPLSDADFAFLLCHSGYIPEEYGHDSSEETAYSKLVEVLVKEWAIRLGFSDSQCPTAKSSKEDVTIKGAGNVIVCDAKAYRLGRSQRAPNVKDALKEGDISKWLKAYQNDGLRQLGGLVTFPSQHNWTKGSDFYLYLTNKTQPIVCLFYEHMAFLVLMFGQSGAHEGRERLIELYLRYGSVFPVQLTKQEFNQIKYWTAVEQKLFYNINTNWLTFCKAASKVVAEQAYHTKRSALDHVNFVKQLKKNALDADRTLTLDILRDKLAEMEAKYELSDVLRQIPCIENFRSVAKDYYVNE